MAQDNVHLINALPHRYELEDMLEFCKNYERLYICGASENQEYLLKYFDICKIEIDGYTVTDPSIQKPLLYRQIPIVAVEDVIKTPNTGIILALPDKYYRHFIPKFRKAGFSGYFTMSEYNKNTIAGQLKPRTQNQISLEINIADHCNISCASCDHYSQLSPDKVLDYNVYKRDIERMGELFNHNIGVITLLGGEPLLNPDIIKFMALTRQVFPKSECYILTNGVLLPKLEKAPHGNIWQACKDYRFGINVTVYPIKLNYDEITKKAKQYNVPLRISSDIHAKTLTMNTKISDKHTFDLNGSLTPELSISCIYFNKWTVLKDGRFYMCPISAHVNIFNEYFNQNLELTENDSLDIFSVNIWKDFAEFSSKPISFCRYCDLKNWTHANEWSPSRKIIEEYI